MLAFNCMSCDEMMDIFPSHDTFFVSKEWLMIGADAVTMIVELDASRQKMVTPILT